MICSFNYLLENILNLLLNFKFDGVIKNQTTTELNRLQLGGLDFLTSNKPNNLTNHYSLGSVKTSTLPNLNIILFKLTGSYTNILPTDSVNPVSSISVNPSLTQSSNSSFESLGLSKTPSPLLGTRNTRLRSTQVGEFYIHDFNYQKLNYLSTLGEL